MWGEAIRDGDFCLFVRSFVRLSPVKFLSGSTWRGSTWRRAGAFRIVSDTLSPIISQVVLIDTLFY